MAMAIKPVVTTSRNLNTPRNPTTHIKALHHLTLNLQTMQTLLLHTTQVMVLQLPTPHLSSQTTHLNQTMVLLHPTLPILTNKTALHTRIRTHQYLNLRLHTPMTVMDRTDHQELASTVPGKMVSVVSAPLYLAVVQVDF